MAGYIEDRWLTKRPDPKTGQRRKTARYGKGKRYRVAGIPGVRDHSFVKIEEARAWRAKAEHQQRAGEFVDPRMGQILLADYIDEHWLPSRAGGDPATASTVRGRLEHVRALLGSQPLFTIKTPQLRVFLTGLGKRVGPATVHEVWGYLKAILQAAVEDERIPKNYCKSKTIKLPTIPERKVRPWTKERIVAVQAALPERFRAMVDVGVGAGLRQGEIFGLAVEDIDEDAEVLHVRRQVKAIGAKLAFALPKGGKTRTVPVPAYLLARLREHMKAHPAKKITLPWGDPRPPTNEREERERAPRTFELIFTGVRGGALRRDIFDTGFWKPALAAEGVIPEPELVRVGKQSRLRRKYAVAREHGMHVLRHTFASVQLHARENPVAVSKWMGHADPSITLRIYAHLMPEADGRGRAAMQEWFKAAA